MQEKSWMQVTSHMVFIQLVILPFGIHLLGSALGFPIHGVDIAISPEHMKGNPVDAACNQLLDSGIQPEQEYGVIVSELPLSVAPFGCGDTHNDDIFEFVDIGEAHGSTPNGA